MLYLTNSKGVINSFSINIYDALYASTIGAKTEGSSNRQFIRTGNFSKQVSLIYYIELTERATGQSYFTQLSSDVPTSNYPRSIKFSLFFGDDGENNQLDIKNDGIYSYKIFSGLSGAFFDNDQYLYNELHSGLALIQSENMINNQYQNSENGMVNTDIPNSIAYNG